MCLFYLSIRAIFYNLKKADRIETGLSLNNRTKQAENKKKDIFISQQF